jgi:hypothetical protein
MAKSSVKKVVAKSGIAVGPKAGHTTTPRTLKLRPSQRKGVSTRARTWLDSAMRTRRMRREGQGVQPGLWEHPGILKSV